MITFAILMWMWAGLAIFMAKKGDLDRSYSNGEKLVMLFLFLLFWPGYPLLYLSGNG